MINALVVQVSQKREAVSVSNAVLVNSQMKQEVNHVPNALVVQVSQIQEALRVTNAILVNLQMK